jgi:hypothetical protein
LKDGEDVVGWKVDEEMDPSNKKIQIKARIFRDWWLGGSQCFLEISCPTQ